MSHALEELGPGGFCGGWNRFWTLHDPDDVFAYSTLKVVRIRDRQLGLLHHSFQFGILVYIVIYVMIFNHGYLKYDQPVGVIRANIQQCPTGASCDVQQSLLPYCAINNSGISPLQCKFYDEQEATHPVGQGDPMFVGTRVTESTQIRSCAVTQKSCSGSVWTTTNSTSFYVAGVESWSIRLDHSVKAPAFSSPGDTKYQGDNSEMSGELVFEGSSEVLRFEPGVADTFSFKTLLRAARLDLDQLSDSSDDNVPMRYDGAVLLVLIHYDNTYTTFAPASHLRYRVKAKHLSRTEFKTVHPLISDGSQRTVWNMHGVYIEFVQTGTIGKFDLQTMLLQLVTALALLKVSTLVVDAIALHFKKLRNLYKKAIIEETADFSDVRDAIRHASVHGATSPSKSSYVAPGPLLPK